MIEYLSGNLIHHNAGQVVIEANGVGYGVDVPNTTDRHLPSVGEEAQLWIFTRVREDSLKLYGFSRRVERQVFEILISVSGVGPKVALAIFSHFTVGELLGVVAEKNTKVLQEVPGIGKRSAEKILLELEPKIEKLSVLIAEGYSPSEMHSTSGQRSMLPFDELKPSASMLPDLKSALVNLGFKENEVITVSRNLIAEDSSLSFEEVLKKALIALNKEIRTH